MFEEARSAFARDGVLAALRLEKGVRETLVGPVT